jgi:hypothetical protein
MLIMFILSCLFKENHNFQKKQQWAMMQIMCGSEGRKAQGPSLLLSPLTLGPQTLTKKK